MSDLPRTRIPNGGWQFFQPQTKWWAPAPVSTTLGQQRINVIKHRRQNPAIVIKYRLSLVPDEVEQEIVTYNRLRLGLGPEIGTAISPKNLPPVAQPQLSEGVSGAVAAIKKVAAGAALLLEWEESGMPPVSKEQSETRAAICVMCEKNAKGKSLTEIFTEPMANIIKRRYERLQGLSLSTKYDDQLSVCQACLCPLKLKVHTPTELIQKRLKPELKAELAPGCWILSGQ